MPGPDFLQYFVQETNKKFDEIKEEMKSNHGKIEAKATAIEANVTKLLEFKSELTRDAMWRTLLIGTATGAFTFLATLGVTIYYEEKKLTEVKSAVRTEGRK